MYVKTHELSSLSSSRYLLSPKITACCQDVTSKNSYTLESWKDERRLECTLYYRNYNLVKPFFFYGRKSGETGSMDYTISNADALRHVQRVATKLYQED